MSILTIILSITILLQVSYWFFFYANVAPSPPPNNKPNSVLNPISIIVCAKNEEENVSHHIGTWISQLSPEDELIIVDDFSTDKTHEIAGKLTSHLPNAKVLRATTDKPGKKQALTEAVTHACNHHILLTDADCTPLENWKTHMAAYLNPSTRFVLGYAPFHRLPTILNLFQRYEGILTAAQYFSYAHIGLPYMGVGRNILIHKSSFASDPYLQHDIASGDDDLLVSALATRENTELCLEPESFVYSQAKPTLKSYLSQKLRHISTSPYYKISTKILLSIFSASQIISNLVFIFLLFTCCWKVALIMQLVKYAIATLALKKVAHILKEGNIFLFTPFLDLLLTFYYVILTLAYPFTNQKKWN